MSEYRRIEAAVQVALILLTIVLLQGGLLLAWLLYVKGNTKYFTDHAGFKVTLLILVPIALIGGLITGSWTVFRVDSGRSADIAAIANASDVVRDALTVADRLEHSARSSPADSLESIGVACLGIFESGASRQLQILRQHSRPEDYTALENQTAPQARGH